MSIQSLRFGHTEISDLFMGHFFFRNKLTCKELEKPPYTLHLRGPPAAENPPPRCFDTYSYVLQCHEQLEVATEDKHAYSFLVSYFFFGNLLSEF